MEDLKTQLETMIKKANVDPSNMDVESLPDDYTDFAEILVELYKFDPEKPVSECLLEFGFLVNVFVAKANDFVGSLSEEEIEKLRSELFDT